MASSGSFNTTGYEGRCLTFSWSEKSQSVENNTTTISWTLKGSGDADSSWYKTRSVTLTIDDKEVYSFPGSSSQYITLYNGTTVASGTYTFTHSSDGTKKFTVYAEAGIYVWAANCSGSKTFTLDTIPRKSSLSVSNGTLGTAQKLTVTKQSTNFTHTITATCGTASTTICTKSASTSIDFTPPISWASQNTTGTSVSVTYTITTYSGSTNVGSNSYTKTCSIPSSVKPSCTLTVTDSTGYADTYGNPVKGLSKLKVVVTPTSSYGSPITSYTTTANGNKYIKESFTTDVLKSSGTNTVSTTVKDKRGRSGTDSVSVTVLDYTKPAISKLSVKRCDSDGTSNAQGEYVQVTFTAAVTSLNDKNTAEYDLKYKKSTETNYTSVKISSLQNVYSAVGQTYIFPADTGSSYNVELSVKDNHNTVTRKTNASTGFTLIHWLASGTGMAIGKIAEVANVFDIGLVTRIRKHLNIGNKTGHLDGNTGVFISEEGYIQMQRDTSQGYHPYLAFLLNDDTEHSGSVRVNCNTKEMEFQNSAGYAFDGDTKASGNGYVGTTSSWEDGKCGVRLSKSGGLQIQRTADSSPYIDLFFNGSATYDSRIIHTLATKYMNFYKAARYVFDNTVEAPTLYSKGHVRIGSDGFDSTGNVLQTFWKDGNVHNLVERNEDGLTTAVGWAGSADYATVTRIRGRTCQYQNSSGTTALSDERLKKDFSDLEKWDKFFDALEPCAFKMKCGSSGRFHIGFKAQQVEQALAEAGLTTQDFAGFVRMAYVPDGDDPEGSAIYADAGIKPGDDEFGLIYSEFVALNTFRIQKLQEEVNNLKSEIDELKGLLKNQ